MKARVLCTLALGLLVALPAAAAAQATTVAAVSAAEAAPFLGEWTLMLDTPQGAMPLSLSVKAQAGKVEGEVGSDMLPVQPITDITKAEKSLVMRYTLDFQGNAVPVKITLTPDGEKMTFAFDAAEGQFFLEGAATKK
jgi:hypothetical protein